MLYAFPQDIPQRHRQPLDLARPENITPSVRVDPSPEQRLVRVDVANPGGNPLVEKQGFDACAPMTHLPAQVGRIELWLNRLESHVPQPPQDLRQMVLLDQVNPPQHARLDEHKALPARQKEPDTLEAQKGRGIRVHRELPAEPEVDDQQLAGVGPCAQSDQQILAPAVQPLDPLPDDGLFECRRGRKTDDVASGDPDTPDGPAPDEGFQLAPDRFHFGQLWHAKSLPKRATR